MSEWVNMQRGGRNASVIKLFILCRWGLKQRALKIPFGGTLEECLNLSAWARLRNGLPPRQLGGLYCVTETSK